MLPLGALGDLQYTLSSLPIIGDKSIQLDLNVSAAKCLRISRFGWFIQMGWLLVQDCLFPAV